MVVSLASILILDGVTNGAIYALLAFAIVLVFLVTRVIFVPQSEYVAFSALTLGFFQAGKVPGTVWLLLRCCSSFPSACISPIAALSVTWLLDSRPERIMRALNTSEDGGVTMPEATGALLASERLVSPCCW